MSISVHPRHCVWYQIPASIRTRRSIPRVYFLSKRLPSASSISALLSAVFVFIFGVRNYFLPRRMSNEKRKTDARNLLLAVIFVPCVMVLMQERRQLLFWFTRKTPVDVQKAQASCYFKMLLEPETFPTGTTTTD